MPYVANSWLWPVDGLTFVWTLGLLQAVAILTVAGVALVSDVRWGRIPNRICLAGFLLGLLLSYARGGWDGEAIGLKSSLIAAALGFALFAAFYLLGGMGAGDVKLMAAYGALIGHLPFLLWTLAYTALAGAVLAVIALARRGRGELARGLARGVLQMGRLRYDRPPPDGLPIRTPRPENKRLPAPAPTAAAAIAAAPPTMAAGTEAESGKEEADGEVEKEETAASREPVYIPFAAAMAAGLVLAAFSFWRRGWVWPFFLGAG